MPDVSSWVVVVVDNDMFNLDIAAQMLELYGATVHTADSGETGLQKLEEVKPQFLLLDLSMPHMDGWEVLKRLRANSTFDYLPVIALTAHAMAGDAERALSAGFDGYITKPFKVENLIDDIQAILDKTTRGKTTEATAKPAETGEAAAQPVAENNPQPAEAAPEPVAKVETPPEKPIEAPMVAEGVAAGEKAVETPAEKS